VVLVDYTDDRSLAQARTVIPEAYLEEIPDQGTKIQMGAFLSENEAKALVDQLRQRGITATIYRP
jgi:cell division septation protein DedD